MGAKYSRFIERCSKEIVNLLESIDPDRTFVRSNIPPDKKRSKDIVYHRSGSNIQMRVVTFIQLPSHLPNLPDLVMRSLPTAQPLLAQYTTRRTPRLLVLGSPNTFNPNLGLRKRIHHIPIRRHEIYTNRIRERRNKKAQGYNHAKLRAIPRIRRRAQNRRHNSTTAHSTYNPPRPTLRVFPQSAHAERDDGRENDGLEEQRDEQ